MMYLFLAVGDVSSFAGPASRFSLKSSSHLSTRHPLPQKMRWLSWTDYYVMGIDNGGCYGTHPCSTSRGRVVSRLGAGTFAREELKDGDVTDEDAGLTPHEDGEIAKVPHNGMGAPDHVHFDGKAHYDVPKLEPLSSSPPSSAAITTTPRITPTTTPSTTTSSPPPIAADAQEVDAVARRISSLSSSSKYTWATAARLSGANRSMMSRTKNMRRQRFVTGRYPLRVMVEENPTQKYLGLAESRIYLNG